MDRSKGWSGSSVGGVFAGAGIVYERLWEAGLCRGWRCLQVTVRGRVSLLGLRLSETFLMVGW